MAGENCPSPFDRRAFPQQQALDRQRRVAMVLMRAGGIAEPIACALQRLDVARRELPAWIGEVHNRRADVIFDRAFRSFQLRHDGVRAIPPAATRDDGCVSRW